MCECIAQLSTAEIYLKHLDQPSAHLASDGGEILENSTPITAGLISDLRDRDHVIRPNQKLTALVGGDTGLHSLRIRWGWSPIWSMGTRPPLTHLPLDIVMRSKVFERMRETGRVLVAVEGWFEEYAERGGQCGAQFMRPRHPGPVYLGALAQLGEYSGGCNGLVLVTHDGGGAAGPLKLMAFTSKDAMHWLNPALSWQHARDLVSTNVLGEQAFEQVPVSQRFARKQHA